MFDVIREGEWAMDLGISGELGLWRFGIESRGGAKFD